MEPSSPPNAAVMKPMTGNSIRNASNMATTLTQVFCLTGLPTELFAAAVNDDVAATGANNGFDFGCTTGRGDGGDYHQGAQGLADPCVSDPSELVAHGM